jgi:hypothetical protein
VERCDDALAAEHEDTLAGVRARDVARRDDRGFMNSSSVSSSPTLRRSAA